MNKDKEVEEENSREVEEDLMKKVVDNFVQEKGKFKWKSEDKGKT